MSRRQALPATSANALSSLAYAPDEIVLTLAAAGTAALALGPAVGWSVVAVMALLAVALRAAVLAVPHGGIERMARAALGPRWGVLAAAALLLDFVLTAAVSVAAAAHHLAVLMPALHPWRTPVACAAMVLVLLVVLRGPARRRWPTTVLVSAFVALMAALVAVGLWQQSQGALAPAPTAGLTVAGAAAPVGVLATVLLCLRAFGVGSVLITGLEVPLSATARMARPAAPAARWVITVLALTLGALTVGVMHLTARTGVVTALDPTTLRTHEGRPPADAPAPVVAQLADTVFGHGSAAALALVAVTAVLLLLAAKSAFRSFPVLAARLAEDGYLPRQLRSRDDRLVHTWGVVVLGALALGLVLAFQARTALLVQLYVIGVMLAFTLGLAGLVRVWRRRLAQTPGRRARTLAALRLRVTELAFAVTALACTVVLVTRFAEGAWVALAVIGVCALGMGRVRRHYAAVAAELAPDPQDDARALPSRVHVMVVVSTVNRPTLRALAYARATRPSSLEAVVVDVDRETTERVIADWTRARLPVPLTVIASPYRDSVVPLVRHLRSRRRRSPRDLTMVFLPEYVVRPGWRTLLHNRTAARQRRRLQREAGVMVGSVPWQIREGEAPASDTRP